MDTKKAMAWFIIILMSLSVLGFIGGSLYGGNSDSSTKTEYNGFTFYNRNFRWEAQIQGQTYSFQYLPTELENITFAVPLDDLRSSPRMYLGYKPNDTIAVQPYLQHLARVLFANGIIPQDACTEERNCPDIPVLDCTEKPGIMMLAGEHNAYAREEKCIVITIADTAEAQKATERLIYGWLGVMPTQ